MYKKIYIYIYANKKIRMSIDGLWRFMTVYDGFPWKFTHNSNLMIWMSPHFLKPRYGSNSIPNKMDGSMPQSQQLMPLMHSFAHPKLKATGPQSPLSWLLAPSGAPKAERYRSTSTMMTLWYLHIAMKTINIGYAWGLLGKYKYRWLRIHIIISAYHGDGFSTNIQW